MIWFIGDLVNDVNITVDITLKQRVFIVYIHYTHNMQVKWSEAIVPKVRNVARRLLSLTGVDIWATLKINRDAMMFAIYLF